VRGSLAKVSNGPAPAKRLHFSGRGVTALDDLEKDILAIVEGIRTKKGVNVRSDGEADVILVIDQPDFLLAATGPDQGIGAAEMIEWVMGMEQVWKSSS
jgi:elongator complex protein 6